MRQPALADMVWRLRDSLTFDHWIRDDADYVRGEVIALLRCVCVCIAYNCVYNVYMYVCMGGQYTHVYTCP